MDSSEAQPREWSVKEIIRWGIKLFHGHGLDTPRLDCELLLSKATGLSRIELLTKDHYRLENRQRELLEGWVHRRLAGEPIAYIFGEKEFYGLGFRVTPDVLIPRPETELIVDLVRGDVRGREGLSILDVGAGSGCLAITLKSLFKNASVEAWDVSEPALTVAAENAERHGACVNFLRRDALQSASWRGEPFDVIVSNPPYVNPADQTLLQEAVRRYEPHLALFADDDGLAFYKAIAEHAPSRLKSKGKIFLEIGADQREAVTALLSGRGWRRIRGIQDLAGHDRVVTAEAPR